MLFLSPFLLVWALVGCVPQGDLPFVSLEPPPPPAVPSIRVDHGLRVGIAPVFSAVSAYEHYAPLMAWLSERLERPVELVQRGTYHEINELTRRGAVDVAFVCSGPWLLNGEGLRVLTVPVIHGAPTYQAVCLVPEQQRAANLEELRGGSFAFTDALSLTGRAYTRARLARLGATPETFFRRIVQVEGHDVLLHLLARGDVDGGCVNSLAWEDFREDEPLLAARLREIERSPPFGAPPVLVSADQDPALTAALRAALESMDEDPAGQRILATLHVEAFEPAPPQLYDEARRYLEVLAPVEGR